MRICLKRQENEKANLEQPLTFKLWIEEKQKHGEIDNKGKQIKRLAFL